QWRALSRQIPLLYAMLLANTLIVAITHVSVAPVMLTIYVPAALTVLCVLRVAMWWGARGKTVSPEKARRDLRNMIWAGAILAIGFTAWSRSLFPYDDAYLQSRIWFYMSITSIGCMFCLMHVRTAAMVVGVCVLLPFVTFFASTGQPAFMAIAINLVL